MGITKLELSNRIARKMGHKHPEEIKKVISTLLGEVLQALSEGDKIELRGFGTFDTKFRNPRIGRNPRTGDIIDIPECVVPIFRFSKQAQNRIRQNL